MISSSSLTTDELSATPPIASPGPSPAAPPEHTVVEIDPLSGTPAEAPSGGSGRIPDSDTVSGFPVEHLVQASSSPQLSEPTPSAASASASASSIQNPGIPHSRSLGVGPSEPGIRSMDVSERWPERFSEEYSRVAAVLASSTRSGARGAAEFRSSGGLPADEDDVWEDAGAKYESRYEDEGTEASATMSDVAVDISPEDAPDAAASAAAGTAALPSSSSSLSGRSKFLSQSRYASTLEAPSQQRLSQRPPKTGPITESQGVVSIHINNLRQFFNSLDPSPFRERDLDAKAAQFIETYANATNTRDPLIIRIFLDTEISKSEERETVDAVRFYYETERDHAKVDLKSILREGQTSLLVGILIFIVCIAASASVETTSQSSWWSVTLTQSFTVLAWVALWKPIETVLYRWWPTFSRIRLLSRIAGATVQIVMPRDIYHPEQFFA